MKRCSSHRIGVLGFVVTATSACAGGDGMQAAEVKPPATFEIPFAGPGQLATIWSWGRDRPEGGKALVLTADGASRRVPVDAPTRVRWRSPRDLIVEQFVRPLREGSGIRILRIAPGGEVLEVLSDREGMAHSEPSPDGRWIAVERYDQEGLSGLEIRGLAGGLPLRSEHPERSNGGSLAGGVVWSPDASRIVVPMRFPNPPDEPGRLYPRLAIAPRDVPGFTRLSDAAQDGSPERGGVTPLFWTTRGIYARSSSVGRGLLLCDPGGSGCTPVYGPGEHRSVLMGRVIGDDRALLLVKDFTVDPLEARTKEIHELDLSTGEGRVLLRMPEGVFLNDLDWVGGEGDPR